MRYRAEKAYLPADPQARAALLAQARNGELNALYASNLLLLARGFVTVYDSASLLRVTRQQVVRWLDEGKLEGVRTNGLRFVLVLSLQRWQRQRDQETREWLLQHGDPALAATLPLPEPPLPEPGEEGSE